MSNSELNTKWNSCLEFIQDNVEPMVYETWFTILKPVSLDNNTLLIEAPSSFVCEFIEENYLNEFQAAVCKYFGNQITVDYKIIVDKTNSQSTTVRSQEFQPAIIKNQKPLSNTSPSATDAPQVQDLDSMLNTKYSFSNFIEGYSNKMARIAGETIAQNPGSTSFNPLFIHGSSGVGKTHLLNAIGMKVKELHPDKRVLYVSSHLFHIQFIDAIRSNNTNDFIHFYQTIDVLIIDDMQELSGFPKTTNTFFHIFNHLHQNRKQLIMSCDRHPKDLKDIEERMITRFKWGLVTELEKPDLQLRKDILRDKTSRDGLVVNNEVIDFAAENITGSVRDLEGFIASLMAHSTFYNKEINLELTKDILNKNSKKEEKPITIESIINTVCEYFDVDVDAIQTKSRKHEVVQVRQISMYLAKKHLDFSTSKIGAYIGKRDHATVLHACNMVKDQLQVDKNFRKDMENIESSLKS